MAKETKAVKAAKSGSEILGFTLLICTPSALNEAWMAAKTPKDAAKALKDFGFSDVTQQVAAQFLSDHFPSRQIFGGLAALHQEAYGGASPHPATGDAKKIVAFLQGLDHTNPGPK